MKTTILLDLSRNSVRLLQDDGGAATVLGEVALDDPDFDARIGGLRQRAAGAGETIVLVPRSEVLFFDLDPTGGGDASDESAIREALEGRTPYALADLAFDWRRRDDGRLAVAAVARETLDEAEAFAAAQGFAPTGYGSLAEPSLFEGRADFGLRGAVKSAARPAPSEPVPADAPAATEPSLSDEDAGDETGIRPDGAAEGNSERRAAVPQPRDASARDAGRPTGPQSPPPMRPEAPPDGRAASAPVGAEVMLPPDLGTLPRLMAEDRTARLSLPKRPDGAEAMPVPGPPPTPPPRRPAKPPGRPVAARLAAVLALAALAGGSFLLLGTDDSEPAPPENVAAAPDTPSAPLEEEIASSAEAPTALDAATPAAPGEAPPETEPAENIATSAPATPELALEDPLNRPADAPEAGRYAATGVEATPPAAPQPPAGDRASDLGDSAADPELALPEGAVALENPLGDLPPPAQIAAPSNATVAPEEETEAPTGEGMRTPSGVLVFTGAPPITPPAAPGRTAPSVQSASDTAAPAAEVETTPDPAELRPAGGPETATGTDAQSAVDGLRAAPAAPETAAAVPGDVVERARDALRPRARPSAANIAAPAELTDRDEATIAALAPRPRPQDSAPDAAGEPFPTVVDRAAVAAATASALEETLPEEPPNPYAVATSLNPRTRPQDLAAAAADDEPPVQVAIATPVPTRSAPTRPGAAESATTPDRLSLGRVNLIGVYGSPSNRRALVRLPSGRFAKVKVGDQVDGGRVRAIGDADLSYVKSGRSITLQMPSG